MAHDAEVVETVVDDVAAPRTAALAARARSRARDFSVADAIGGVRGLVESVAPGLVFVVVYVATTNLRWALVTSVAAALVAVAARLVQRTPVTQAFGGLLGVGIGVLWAWRSGRRRTTSRGACGPTPRTSSRSSCPSWSAGRSSGSSSRLPQRLRRGDGVGRRGRGRR